jgi:hypothetical protein
VIGEACSCSEDSLELHTKFWPDNIKGKHNIGDVPVDTRRILKWDKMLLLDSSG